VTELLRGSEMARQVKLRYAVHQLGSLFDHLVGGGKQREVAVDHAEERDDRGLVGGDAVEAALSY
jgi:hypothetical protein